MLNLISEMFQYADIRDVVLSLFCFVIGSGCAMR